MGVGVDSADAGPRATELASISGVRRTNPVLPMFHPGPELALPYHLAWYGELLLNHCSHLP
jgi:hypothetical protein